MSRISAADKLRQNQEKAKQVLKTKESQKVPAEVFRVNEMAQTFETALGIYKDKPGIRRIKGWIRPDDESFCQWLRAVQFADELGVEFVTYVSAQFFYFDKVYQRAPKMTELAAIRTARQRVGLYLNYGRGDTACQ